jgi:hypothetical protein
MKDRVMINIILTLLYCYLLRWPIYFVIKARRSVSSNKEFIIVFILPPVALAVFAALLVLLVYSIPSTGGIQ